MALNSLQSTCKRRSRRQIASTRTTEGTVKGDFPRKDDFYSHGLYERLMHLAPTREQKLPTSSARSTGQPETRSQTPGHTERNGQQPASQLQSFGASRLQISVSSDATSAGQVATSQSATPSREVARLRRRAPPPGGHRPRACREQVDRGLPRGGHDHQEPRPPLPGQVGR